MQPHKAFDIPILMYHDVQTREVLPDSPAYEISLRAFEQQLDFLARHDYRVINFSKLFDIINGIVPRTGKEVLITFDDGYESFRTLVTPALLSRGLTATLFIVASQIGGYNKWDYEALPGCSKRLLMDEQATREVIAAGMEIGIHGWAHRDLRRCSNTEMAEEVVYSKQYVEDLLGYQTNVFAYPYGNYLTSHFDLLEEAGYMGAASIFSHEKFVTANLYAMRRVYIHPNDNILRFRAKLSRPYLRYKALRGHPQPSALNQS
jgi:peptidoglycan/xylan/chitin deacetylase (PgdA/CDA1 family)